MTVSSDGQIMTFNDNLTCDDKMAQTTATLSAPPSKKETGTSSVNTRQSSHTTEEQMVNFKKLIIHITFYYDFFSGRGAVS